MNVKEITEFLIEELHLNSLVELAEKLDVTLDRAKNLSSGRVKKFKPEEIDKIKEISTLTEKDIRLGIAKQQVKDMKSHLQPLSQDEYDELQKQINIAEKDFALREQKNNTIDIKYFSNSYGSMGEGGVSYETLPSVMSFDKDFLVNAIGIQNFKDLFIINAVGNSMSPTIEDNSKLFITPFENEGNTFIDGGVYVIYAPQSGYLVKRVMLNSFDGSITLQSDNENYDNVVMTKDILDDCKVVGRVVGNFSSKV